MKVLEGIEQIKYMALLAVYRYDKTGDKIHLLALHYLIDEAWSKYGPKGRNEVVDFIDEERL